MKGSCLGLFSPRLWLSEGDGSVPGPTKGLASTFSEDTSFPPVFPSTDCGWDEPPPDDSLFELLPGCENEPLGMLCTPPRSPAGAPSAGVQHANEL